KKKKKKKKKKKNIRKALIEEHEEQMKLLEAENDKKEEERLSKTADNGTQKELDKLIDENNQLRKALDEREMVMHKLQQRSNRYALLLQEKKTIESKHLTLQKEFEVLNDEIHKLQTVLQIYETNIQQLTDEKLELQLQQPTTQENLSNFVENVGLFRAKSISNLNGILSSFFLPYKIYHRSLQTLEVQSVHSNTIPNLEEQMLTIRSTRSQTKNRKSFDGDDFEQKHHEAPALSPSNKEGTAIEKAAPANASQESTNDIAPISLKLDQQDKDKETEKEKDKENCSNFPQTWEEILKSLNTKNLKNLNTRPSRDATSIVSNESEQDCGERLFAIEEQLQSIKEVLKQLCNNTDPIHLTQEIRPFERLLRQLHIKMDGQIASGACQSNYYGTVPPSMPAPSITPNSLVVKRKTNTNLDVTGSFSEDGSVTDTVSSHQGEFKSYFIILLFCFFRYL
ncbi:viral A-type inclusion protein, partial [Reticulomyxa filosa]